MEIKVLQCPTRVGWTSHELSCRASGSMHKTVNTRGTYKYRIQLTEVTGNPQEMERVKTSTRRRNSRRFPGGACNLPRAREDPRIKATEEDRIRSAAPHPRNAGTFVSWRVIWELDQER